MIADELARGRWPEGEGNSVGVMPTLRTCGARPSGGGAQDGWPSGEMPGNNAKGDFLGGARSPRPGGKAGGGPGHVVITDELEGGRWPKGEGNSVGVMPTSRACGARPSEGVSQGEVAYRGKAGNDARGGFLGGARSPRPGGRAVRKRGVGRDERGVIERPVA
jgi:hypothetical protein